MPLLVWYLLACLDLVNYLLLNRFDRRLALFRLENRCRVLTPCVAAELVDGAGLRVR